MNQVVLTIATYAVCVITTVDAAIHIIMCHGVTNKPHSQYVTYLHPIVLVLALQHISVDITTIPEY